VTAGVHDADFLAVVDGFCFGREGHGSSFSHRQRVHIRTQRDHRPGTSAFEQANNPGFRDVRFYLNAKRAEMLRDEFGRAEFVVPEFGMLMDVAAPFDDFWFDGISSFVNASGERMISGEQ
jgi:hypothetical protein